MSEENGSGRVDPLAGWVIVVTGGRMLLGKARAGQLAPVYDFQPIMEPTPKGLRYDFVVAPALGIVSVKALPIPPGSIMVAVEELSPEERRAISQSVVRTDELLRRLRAGSAGLVVTSKMPGDP